MNSLPTLLSKLLATPAIHTWKFLTESYGSWTLSGRSHFGKKTMIVLATVYLLQLIIGLKIFDLGIILSFVSRFVIFLWFQRKIMTYFIFTMEFWLLVLIKSSPLVQSLSLLSLSMFFSTVMVIFIIIPRIDSVPTKNSDKKSKKELPDIEKLVASYDWKHISITDLQKFLNKLRLNYSLSMPRIEKITQRIIEKNRFRMACSKPTKLYEALEQIWNNNRQPVHLEGREFQLLLGKNLPGSLALDSDIFPLIVHDIIREALHFSVGGSLQLRISWLEAAEITDQSFEPSQDEGSFEIRASNCVTDLAFSDYPFFSIASIIQRICDSHRERFPFLYSKGILKFSVSVTDCQISKNLAQAEQNPERLTLFLTKKIIESMNGELRILRRAKNKLEFVVCMTSYSTISEASPPNFFRQPRKDQRKTPRSKSDRLRALVISDSNFAPSYAKYLKTKNFEAAAVCSNATQALEMYNTSVAENKPIHVILIEFSTLRESRRILESIRAFEASEEFDCSIINIIHPSFSEDHEGLLNEEEVIKADYLIQSPIDYQDFECAISLWNSQVRRANAFLTRVKVLIADENPFVRAALVSMLDEEYSYIEAENDHKVLGLYADNCVELAVIICNFSAAKENHFEMVEEIRKIQMINNIQGLKIIAQVNKIDNDVLKEAKENEIDFVIEKPLRKSTLKKLIRNAINSFRES